MGKKFFYIFTVLLFSLSAASAATDTEGKQLFPLMGGTTSDGIVVSEPLLDGFQVTTDNMLNVVGTVAKATAIFTVTVPDGKVAVLEYSGIVKAMKPKGAKVRNPQTFFSVRYDDKLAKHHKEKAKIEICSEFIRIGEGKHTVILEGNCTPEPCILGGTLNPIYIHIHDFTEPKLLREPICGQPGIINSKCIICGIDSTRRIAPKYQAHVLKKNATTKTSCMSNIGSLTFCEQCPYSEIERKDSIVGHDFDEDGRCRECKLRRPKSNAEHSVYEIYEASELRVLSELISLGIVPGNIGIDIKADLKFSRDTTMTPLGTFEHPFQGVLNGNGHRIRGISNCFQGVDCLGLVGVAKGTLTSHAVIANLIYDAENTMKGTACVGGIVGYASCCDIVNCASFGALEGLNYVGSIVGYADQYVSFQNCASVSSIRTQGNWNPMACGLPHGRILNSYGAATNSLGGAVDELATTTFRHCFTTMGSDEGLTFVSPDVMSSYNMVEMLNQQSESPAFVMSENDAYPLPVVNTTIKAMPNADIPTKWKAIPRRVMLGDVTDGGYVKSEKDSQIEVYGGYVDETATAALGMTLEEVVRKDSVQYDDFDRAYILTCSVDNGDFEMFEPISGGSMQDFESYMLAPDSTYLKYTRYYVSGENVKPVTETIDDWSGPNEQIDEYDIKDGIYRHVSHIIIENEDKVTYQENVDGRMMTTWSLKTVYNESGEAVAIETYSHNHNTGETRLEYRYEYDSDDSSGSGDSSGSASPYYAEYVDEATNTIHIIFNDLQSNTNTVISREHYILSADDQYLREIRTEKMIDGKPYLIDGMYFVYNNDDGDLLQCVAYGPEDSDDLESDLRAYQYMEFLGIWKTDPYPTAIQIPTVEKPSIDKQKDYTVYDIQGRVVRRVTNLHDPFSGLPKGLYIYQGSKYLKRN